MASVANKIRESVPAMPLISLPLTNVQLDPNDSLAYFFAYLTLAPLFIGTAYIVLLARRKEPVVAVTFVGQILCAALNVVLKAIVKEDRPTDVLGEGYGMPSSHAAFIFYFSTFWSLHLMKRCDTFKKVTHKIAAAVCAIAFAVLVGYSRIYLGYHTRLQVLVGALVGTVFAASWYAFVEETVRPGGKLRFLLTPRVARYLATEYVLVDKTGSGDDGKKKNKMKMM